MRLTTLDTVVLIASRPYKLSLQSGEVIDLCPKYVKIVDRTIKQTGTGLYSKTSTHWLTFAQWRIIYPVLLSLLLDWVEFFILCSSIATGLAKAISRVAFCPSHRRLPPSRSSSFRFRLRIALSHSYRISVGLTAPR